MIVLGLSAVDTPVAWFMQRCIKNIDQHVSADQIGSLGTKFCNFETQNQTYEKPKVVEV